MTNETLNRANKLMKEIDFHKKALRDIDMVRNSISANPSKVMMTIQSFETEDRPGYAYNIDIAAASAIGMLDGMEESHKEKLQRLESALAAL